LLRADSTKALHCTAVILDAGWHRTAGFTVNAIAVRADAVNLVHGRRPASEPDFRRRRANVGVPSVSGQSVRLRQRHVRVASQTHQGICADLIASIEGITREQLDSFAYHARCARKA